ncbi:MAG: hypothetical protein BGP25_05355 [Lysobacterales bacterium 63-13]|nr:MAG: hypothetical protein BGP25_05355 [Xanthomonadales bacterium 63-13]
MIDPERAQALGAVLAGIAAERPGFVRRKVQDRMIAVATTVLEAPEGEARITGIEAPTGVGKSLGYLVPSLLSAQAHGKKLLVVTATVALQQQVVPDIETVIRASGRDLKVAVVKGRGRYLCDRNARLLSGEDPDQGALDFGSGAISDGMESPSSNWPFRPSLAERDAVTAMVDARRSGTWDGDLDTWSTTDLSARLKGAVTTSTSGCAGQACARFARCPVMAAKAKTWTADVLVANLSVLLTDLAMGGGVLLPSMSESIVVVDEAHHLPGAAVAAFAGSMSLGDHGKRLKSVERATAAAAQLLGTSGVTPAMAMKLADGLGGLRANLPALGRALLPLLDSRPDTGHPRVYGQPQVRRVAVNEWAPLAIELDAVHEAAKALTGVVEKLRKKAAETGSPRATALVRDLGMAEDWLDGLRRVAKLVQYDPAFDTRPPVAVWLERGANGEVTLHAAPVTAAAMLASTLWEQCHAAILTSATLSTFGTFDHFASATGLSRLDGVRFSSLPSPFDLASAAVLSVPAMRASPTDNGAYLTEVVAELSSRVDPGEGTLVLFASGALMRAVYDALPEDLRAITTKQGDAPVQVMLDQHRSTVDAGSGHMLFGLATLAEGVDLVGRYNAHTVIVKLPFPTPDDPVLAAHAEWLESKGVSPFGALFLPAVFRKLVQSCGRLIRTDTDRGRITILDNRLLTKPYGRRLLDHLPPYRRDLGDTRAARAA